MNIFIYPFFYTLFIIYFCVDYIIHDKKKVSLNALILVVPLCFILINSIISQEFTLDFFKFLLNILFLVFSLIFLLNIKNPIDIDRLNRYLFYFSSICLILISMQVIFASGLNLISTNYDDFYNQRYDYLEMYRNFYFGAGGKNTIAFYLLVLFIFSFNYSIKNNFKFYTLISLIVFLFAQLTLASGITLISFCLFFFLFFIKKYSNFIYFLSSYFLIFVLIIFHLLIFLQSNNFLSLVDSYLDNQGGIMYRFNILWPYIMETYNFFGNGIFYMQDMNFNTSSAHNIFFQALGDFGFFSLLCLVLFCIFLRKYSIDYFYLPVLYSVSFHMGFYEPFFISALLFMVISFKNEAS